MPITVEEGKDLSLKFIAGFQAGFAKNNHAETLGPMLAEDCSCNWSDGTVISGDKGALLDVFQKTWGFMVSRVIAQNPIFVVDTDNSTVIVTFPNFVINIDGGMQEPNLIENQVAFLLKFTEGKCSTWDGYWDNKDPAMQAALASVAAKLEKSKA